MSSTDSAASENVLVLNAGSSSIKFKLFSLGPSGLVEVAEGQIDKIGEGKGSHLKFHNKTIGSESKTDKMIEGIKNHHDAVEEIMKILCDPLHGVIPDAQEHIHLIGHRWVHGGPNPRFHVPVRVDAEVLEELRTLEPLAPLHIPPALMTIDVTSRLFPGNVDQYVVCDTAFHRSIPAHAYTYAVPAEWRDKHHLRRYGFHGTSHLFVGKLAAQTLGIEWNQARLITLHLGNGSSATCIRDGQSIDTSMGFTPLDGLVMGTRCGNIDPSCVEYVCRATGQTAQQVTRTLNSGSGLRALCGSNDLRDILARADSGDPDSKLALDVLCYSISKYVAQYYVALEGKVDAIVFTGGIGEHAVSVRERLCSSLACLGVRLDPVANARVTDDVRSISLPPSDASYGVRNVLVVPTNEELEIAQQVVAAAAVDKGGPSN